MGERAEIIRTHDVEVWQESVIYGNRKTVNAID